MASRAEWSFLLRDATGTPLAELVTAAGRTVEYKRNAYAEAALTLSHEDDAAYALFEALSEGIPLLTAYRRGPNDSTAVLRFAGYLAPFSEQAEETALLSLVFRSPFGRLIGDGSSRGRFTGPAVTFAATDQGQIAKQLIDAANASSLTGLVTTGAIETTTARDRTYQSANVGQAVFNLTNVIGGFDFEEDFTAYSGSTLAALNIMATAGQDRPNARFEYGPDTLNNIRSFQRTTESPINVATVLGANGLVSTAVDQASIDKYGEWPTQVSASDVSEQATLDAKAQELLRPTPIKTVTFTPEYALSSCPQPWDDFDWNGDTVRLFARRGALSENTSVRLNGMKVAIDENGFEASEISDPQTPDEEATIRATLSMEVQG